MMVTFISQCEKKALNRTRRVLDAFANRIGDNTWQTVITQEGLLAVKKLLRKTASKNTAVSCHWIRSRSRSELVWVVGNRDKFNSEGHVAVNTTRSNFIKSSIENNWPYLPLIKALVAVAALLHDWGKASLLFQMKLKPNKNKKFKGDPIRHEWISSLLLQALIKNTSDEKNLDDSQWLNALSKGNIDEEALIQTAKEQCQRPLANLPPIAQLVAWLIVSHHRLPLKDDKNLKGQYAENINDILIKITQEWAYQNRYDEQDYIARVKDCFSFPKGLMSDSTKWQKDIKKWAQRLLDCESLAKKTINDGSYRLVLTQSRLCLMLGDHYFSSQDAAKNWQGNTALFANTDSKTRELKQNLDEHLIGVAKQSLNNAHKLPLLETALPCAEDVVTLKKPSPADYRWQNIAVNNIKTYRNQNPKVKGAFIVNMASTGRGKTFANAKVMRAFSNTGEQLRFTLALGLRTLTLQTGDEYRERVGLDNSELAVLIGSRAVMDLHQQKKEQEENKFEKTGSESQEALLEEDIDFDSPIPEQGLATLFKTNRDKQFLYAPVLACTIDHLMAATETKRGGRYILPTLRLMSADLVIDEIDDFSGDDLIAIGRLINLAAMLGRKVMISSATIPPSLAEGYFKAYRDGWQIHCKAREENLCIATLWIDEFNTQATNNHELEFIGAIRNYREEHTQFINKRVKNLAKEPAKRKATITPCQSLITAKENHQSKQAFTSEIQNKQQQYFDIILQSARALHQDNHTIDQATQIATSFGVVRMANISPCVALAKYLLNAPLDNSVNIRIMAYHSQQTLLLRHQQEQHLDHVLKRKEAAGEPPQAFSNAIIRTHLDQIHQHKPSVKHVLFILVCTPVEEVGRDHDFDWAVIEPSSYRSIIQLAGRVRRHRKTASPNINIHLLQYNWRGIKFQHNDKEKAFIWPGFEDALEKEGIKKLSSHDLAKLISEKDIAERLDATPRIQQPKVPQFKDKLADLEHFATKMAIAKYEFKDGKFIQTEIGPASFQGYLHEPWFLTALGSHFTPFRSGAPSTKVFLVLNEETNTAGFCIKNDKGEYITSEAVLSITQTTLTAKHSQRLWLQRDYIEAITQQAELDDTSLKRASQKYGEMSFLYSEGNQYEYNDQWGLVKVEPSP